MIDTKKIEEHIYGILKALGDDPEREGLKKIRLNEWRRCMAKFLLE